MSHWTILLNSLKDQTPWTINGFASSKAATRNSAERKTSSHMYKLTLVIDSFVAIIVRSVSSVDMISNATPKSTLAQSHIHVCVETLSHAMML